MTRVLDQVRPAGTISGLARPLPRPLARLLLHTIAQHPSIASQQEINPACRARKSNNSKSNELITFQWMLCECDLAGGEVRDLSLLCAAPVHQASAHHVVGVAALATVGVAHAVHPLHRDRVAGRLRACLDLFGIPPPPPVRPYYRTDLTAEKAVGQRDEESLEGEKNVPGDYEDGCEGGVRLGGPHYGDQVGDAKQRHDHYERLGGPQVDRLCVLRWVSDVAVPQLGDDHGHDPDEEDSVTEENCAYGDHVGHHLHHSTG